MSETVSPTGLHETIPEQLDQDWTDAFEARYALAEGNNFTATVTVEDWLEQPETGGIGSEYFEFNEQMTTSGWWQTISGKVHSAAYTNLPPSYRDGFAHVLALTDACRKREDGSEEPLAEGRLVLVRLDRLRDGIALTELTN